MSYRVVVSASFEAAHNLIHYRGQAEPLHGHSYRVEVAFEAETLDADSLAVDFVEAKSAVEKLAQEFDYTCLNDHAAFSGRNTSAENIARYFAEKLHAAEATVWEGPVNRATYRAT